MAHLRRFAAFFDFLAAFLGGIGGAFWPFFLVLRAVSIEMATACLTGLPARTSAPMFFPIVFLLAPLRSGMTGV